ncbi:unnamed protein product [Effrenium voratum]|uniref:Uncharacterized protein n=1 Tax=Effrenium voratum TaxID=2562239 RepID=A0AA36J360_9DINO|nr:unnamed protein product [Effrenium voratum]
MPKPIAATVDELDAAKTELKALIAKLHKGKADKEEVQPPATRVQNNVDDLTAVVEENAKVGVEAVTRARQEAKEHSEALTQDLRSEVLGVLGEEEAARQSGQSQLEAQIQQLDVDVRKAFADELTSLCVKIEEEFAAVRQDLGELIERKAQEAADHTNRLQSEVSTALADSEQKALERDQAMRAHVAERLQAAKESQDQVQRELNATAEEDRKNTQAAVTRLHELLEESRSTATSHIHATQEEAAQALLEFKEESHTKLAEVDQRADRHQDFLQMLDQVLARRVEWVLQKASSLSPSSDKPTTPGSPTHQSYFSPKFCAAGCRDMQLELRVGRSIASEMSLFLWCPKHTQLAVRFFAGEKWVTAEKAQHVEGPMAAKRLGVLQDHILEDTLRVGLEILEAIQEVGIENEDSVEAPDTAPYASSSLVFHRHINHRVLSQVRKEVDKMQCKMVKRVEWLLTEADQLERQFPHEQPICSPVFSAGGVDGMQFIFYPMGYRDSTEGFCSLFLYCPAGVHIKCNLNAGSQKRDASNHFKEAGAFGRCNFCRLDSAIDSDTNTALLWLEIEEVIQESKRSMDDERRKGKRTATLELESAAPGPAGSVKLMRIANTDYLTEVRRLPSMWTDQKLGDFVKKPEGYRNFKELVGRAKVGATPGKPAETASAAFGTARGAQSTAPSARQPEPARAESMPALRSERVELIAPGPESLPLLCGPQGEFGADQGYGSPLLWAGKSRKARGSASFRQRF